MTLLFCDGFDTYTNSVIAPGSTLGRWSDWNSSDNYPHPVATNPTLGGRGNPQGQAMYFFNSNRWLRKYLPAYSSTLICGAAFFYTGTVYSTTFDPFGFEDMVTFTRGISLRIESSGVLTVRSQDGTTVLATSTNAVLAQGSAWFYLELKATIHNTAGAYSVRLNGQTIAGIPDATNVNTRYSTSVINGANMVRLGTGGNAGATWLIDDYYLCDTNGSVNNDFLGDTRIIGIPPNGVGTYADWTPIGATQNWAAVGDKSTAGSPNIPDGDTSYIAASIIGNKDTYSYNDLPAGITSIRAVVSSPWIRKEDGGARTLVPYVKRGASEAVGPAITVPGGTTYFSPISIMETDPTTSAAWTVANVNASEFGLKVAS